MREVHTAVVTDGPDARGLYTFRLCLELRDADDKRVAACEAQAYGTEHHVWFERPLSDHPLPGRKWGCFPGETLNDGWRLACRRGLGAHYLIQRQLEANACDTAKLREIFSRGLIAGLGSADGQTCIEAAIALACGLPLSDTPPCVAKPDRAYAIKINDAYWSSPQARAEALLPLAFAQVGTAGTDRREWAEMLALGTIQRVLAISLRAAGLDAAADACAASKNLATAINAADAAHRTASALATDAASAAASACAYAYAAAYASATDAATYAAYAAAYASATDAALLRESVAVALDAYARTQRGRDQESK